MFTGIIEALGEVIGLERTGPILNMLVRSTISSELKIDQSVSHDGICLTIVKVQDDTHGVQLIQESLDRTNYKNIKVGDAVNLERSMPATGRFEGHLVQGHVDGIGNLISIENEIYTFSHPKIYAKLIVEKGSVCVNGISLTVASLQDNRFGVAIIPHTLANTNFNNMTPGAVVNLEFDILAKHLARILELRSVD